MKDVISVIVPVYNVSAYLPECLDSILSQDYDKLEVILIDDGSTDDSGAICDTYAQRDGRIRVIHQKNGGAAAAKNAGLRAAAGEYLSFADSDDFLEPNVYGYMLSLLRNYDVDAAVFAFRDVYRNRQEEKIFQPGRQVLTGKEYLVRFTCDWSAALLWNKLYKRALFRDIFFEEGHKIDDEYFTYQGIMNAERVLCDDRVIYNYRRRASSVMNNPTAAERRVLDSLEAIGQRRQKIKARYPELQRVFDESYLDALWYLVLTPGSTERTIAAQRAALRRYLLERGNTVLPRRLWRPLLRMYFSSPRKLLKQPQNAIEQTEDYFT